MSDNVRAVIRRKLNSQSRPCDIGCARLEVCRPRNFSCPATLQPQRAHDFGHQPNESQPHHHDLQALHTTSDGPWPKFNNTKSAHKTNLFHNISTQTSCRRRRGSSKLERRDVRRNPRAVDMSTRNSAEWVELLQRQDRSCSAA